MVEETDKKFSIEPTPSPDLTKPMFKFERTDWMDSPTFKQIDPNLNDFVYRRQANDSLYRQISSPSKWQKYVTLGYFAIDDASTMEQSSTSNGALRKQTRQICTASSVTIICTTSTVNSTSRLSSMHGPSKSPDHISNSTPHIYQSPTRTTYPGNKLKQLTLRCKSKKTNGQKKFNWKSESNQAPSILSDQSCRNSPIK